MNPVRLQQGRLLIALVLLPALCLVARPAPVPASAKEVGTIHGFSLYMLEPTHGRTLLALNPETLQPMDGYSVPLGPVSNGSNPPFVLISGDGATLATVSLRHPNGPTHLAKDITVRVFDAATTIQRVQFHPRVAIAPDSAILSSDGRTISAARIDRTGTWTSWYVLDAANGHVLSRTSLAANCCGPTLYDAQSQRLYVLGSTEKSGATSPGLATLDTYDAAAGRQGDGVVLKDVLAGTWDTGQTVNNGPVLGLWWPGWALSPDGKQLAVLDANDDTLRLINTANMSVEKTERVIESAQSGNVLGRLAAWLGLVPAVASAKEMQGVTLSMQFSPDGKMLLVTGSRGQVAPDGTFTWDGLGVRVLDVSTGAVVADVLPGEQVNWMRMSPDNSQLYLQTFRNNADQSTTFTLQRYDMTTHTIAAQRRYSQAPLLFLVQQPAG